VNKSLNCNPFTLTVYTDHKPLVYIFSKKESTNSSHLKWIISILNAQVTYEEGKNNFIADVLLRIVTINNNDNNKNDLNINDISSSKLVSEQPVETINIITSTNNNHSNVNAESDSDTINTYMKEFMRKRIININGTEYYIQD